MRTAGVLRKFEAKGDGLGLLPVPARDKAWRSAPRHRHTAAWPTLAAAGPAVASYGLSGLVSDLDVLAPAYVTSLLADAAEGASDHQRHRTRSTLSMACQNRSPNERAKMPNRTPTSNATSRCQPNPACQGTQPTKPPSVPITTPHQNCAGLWSGPVM